MGKEKTLFAVRSKIRVEVIAVMTIRVEGSTALFRMLASYDKLEAWMSTWFIRGTEGRLPISKKRFLKAEKNNKKYDGEPW